MAYSKALVHVIAACRVCSWWSEDYLTAQKAAREHHLKTGHAVSVELGYAACYETEPEEKP